MTVCREQPPGTDDGRLGKEQNMGNRLREIRKSQRYSQEQLAQIAGVSRATISIIETGRCEMRMATMRKLAKALRCKPKDLLS